MINNNMCSKFATDYNTINNSLNMLNYPMASNIASSTVCTGIESSAQCNATASTSFLGPPGVGLKLNVGGTDYTDYKTNQACWIRQMNTRFLNNPAMHDYIRTKRDNNHYLPLTAKIPFQPYGTFMDFSKPVYQDARICDLKYTPSAGFKKINNQDLFILKNEKHNNAVIKSALDDFVIVNKHD